MKIVIIGSNGQLGSDIIKTFKDDGNIKDTEFKCDIIPLTHTDIDIKNFKLSEETLMHIKPDIIINCVAYVRVDDAEDNIEEAFSINAIGARNIALVCKRLGTILVYISTDYIFDGTKKEPYTEEDIPNPLNVYGNSKLAGEYFVKNTLENYYIIRSSSLFGIAGSSGKGGNFVETIIKNAKKGEDIKVVDDMIMSPTYTKHLAETIKDILEKRLPFGIYHMANSGECSWYEFAKNIVDMIGIDANIFPIKTGRQKAKRPMYSSLISINLEKYGLKMKNWNIALKDYLIEKRYLNG